MVSYNYPCDGALEPNYVLEKVNLQIPICGTEEKKLGSLEDVEPGIGSKVEHIPSFDLNLGKPNFVSCQMDNGLKRKNVNGDWIVKYSNNPNIEENLDLKPENRFLNQARVGSISKHPYPQVMNSKNTFGALASKLRFESIGKDEFFQVFPPMYFQHKWHE